jgi:mRNA degradation ribonuclease J1/J2
MRDWAQSKGVTIHSIHSGGHAWPEDLDRLEAALHPREIVPVHWDKG